MSDDVIHYLDYANGYPSARVAKAKGYLGTIRYVTSPGLMQPPRPGNKKHITRREYDEYISAGMDVWLVYQGGTDDPDGGFGAGKRNAERALAGCESDVGPKGYEGPIFFCNDRTDIPSVRLWQDYLEGAISVLGMSRVGAYGFANAMDTALGHASWFWQAGRIEQLRPFAHFWQNNNQKDILDGVLCDINVVIHEKAVLSRKQVDTLSWNDESGVVDKDGKPYSYGVLVDYLSRFVNEFRDTTLPAVLDDLAVLKARGGVELSDAQLAKIRSGLASEIVDEIDRRNRDNDPTTGPVS